MERSIPRDGNWKNGIFMSDSLYSAELRDQIRPKAKGLPGFWESKTERSNVLGAAVSYEDTPGKESIPIEA